MHPGTSGRAHCESGVQSIALCKKPATHVVKNRSACQGGLIRACELKKSQSSTWRSLRFQFPDRLLTTAFSEVTPLSLKPSYVQTDAVEISPSNFTLLTRQICGCNPWLNFGRSAPLSLRFPHTFRCSPPRAVYTTFVTFCTTERKLRLSALANASYACTLREYLYRWRLFFPNVKLSSAHE